MSGADAAISSAIASASAERVVADALHDPHAPRLVGVDRTAREQEVTRRTLTGEHRHPPDVARAEVHTESTARNRELRAGCGDTQVARDRELHPGPDRGAVDRGDDRRRMIDDRVEQLLERRPERVDRPVRGRLALLEPRHEVGARAERRTRARDHDGTEIGMRDELIAELLAELAVQRVAPLDAVDRGEPDEASHFELDHRTVRTRRSAR